MASSSSSYSTIDSRKQACKSGIRATRFNTCHHASRSSSCEGGNYSVGHIHVHNKTNTRRHANGSITCLISSVILANTAVIMQPHVQTMTKRGYYEEASLDNLERNEESEESSNVAPTYKRRRVSARIDFPPGCGPPTHQEGTTVIDSNSEYSSEEPSEREEEEPDITSGGDDDE
ncbi:hypothetical protein L1987_15517 [Smallanthus sonchifolius]|uniref:Uncharacterized protein n=1 Tax=Smallanthus sonchifolius TaxID=185202 RepID=A0ACB9J6A5_9ASTR|nr:hypothetical protein L1987_15517 [Smallanthus sonchifolius]